MIRIIVVEPRKEAYTMMVDETTDFIKTLIGENAKRIRPYDDPVAIVYNPDYKRIKMPRCRALTKLVEKRIEGELIEEERIVDFFFGRFLIIQEDENKKPTKFDSVLCRAYKALFLYPESFRKSHGSWCISEYHSEIPSRKKTIAV